MKKRLVRKLAVAKETLRMIEGGLLPPSNNKKVSDSPCAPPLTDECMTPTCDNFVCFY